MDLPINMINAAIMRIKQAIEIIASEDRIYKMSQHPLNQEDMEHVINPATGHPYTDKEIQQAIENAEERAPTDVAMPPSDNPTSVGEHPEEKQPVFMITADSNIFPVGGGQFNIGYDSEWDNFGADSHINSDFSFNATDPNHLNGHLGIDIFGPTGAPILAPVSGEVIQTGVNSSGANRVWIRQLQANGNYNYYYFTHLDTIENIPNGPIQPGTPIGTLGSSGTHTQPHLHYSVFEDVPPNTSLGDVYSSQYAVDPFDTFQDATDAEGNGILS